MHVLFCRGKTGCLACSVPNCVPISRNCNSFNSHWRRDHETIFPDCLRASLFIESPNNGGVVSSIHFIVYCSISASEPQFNSRTFISWSCYSHNLLHNGLGPLRKPTKATHNFLWTTAVAIFFCFPLCSLERTWYYSLCIQRPQFSSRDSGIYALEHSVLLTSLIVCTISYRKGFDLPCLIV